MALPRLIRDDPCPRLAVVLTLTCAGALGGAFQGILSSDVYPKGDAYVWDRIEDCAEFCATAGLAAGVALALVQHLAGRFVLALFLGALTESLRLLVRYPDLFFPVTDVDWDLIGSPLFLGAPLAAALTLSAHAVRTMSTSVRGALAALVVSGILGMQSYSLRDGYITASSLRNPWVTFADYARFLPSLWKGGLLLALCVAVSMYSLELLCIGLRERGASRWSGVSVAAAGLFLLAAGIGLRTWMPFTPASPVCALAFDADGRFLVTAHEGRTLRLWRIEERDPDEGPALREIRKARLPFRTGDHIDMAGDGRRILVTSQSGRILLLKTTSLEPIDDVSYVDQNFHAPALSQDGRFLAVLHGADEVWLWRSGEQDHPLQEPPLVLHTKGLSFLAASFSPDGGFLLGQDSEGDSTVWDAATGDAVWRRGEPDRDAAGPEPGLLFGPRPDILELERMLNEDKSRVLRAYLYSPHASSPDGGHTAVARHGGVYVWDDDPRTLLCVYEGLGGEIGALAFSPDSRYLALGNEHGQVRILKTSSVTGLFFR